MTVTPVIFFALVTTLLVLSLTIFIFLLYLSKLTKRVYSYEKEHENLKSLAAKKNGELLDEARNKTAIIINEATNKALGIIKNANLSSHTFSESFNKGLEKATLDFVTAYGGTLKDIQSKNIELFQNISKDIETSVLSEIKQFREVLKQKTVDSQEMIRQKVEHEYSLAKKDIDSYKETQFKRVDNEIYDILQRVSHLVLGKTIALEDHEQLITEALEKAKQEGVFENGGQ